MRLVSLALLFVLTVPAAAQQDYDDPAITVCELLVRPQFEIEQNSYKRISAELHGQRAVLEFEWGVPGAQPKSEHAECPFRRDGESYVFDLPPDEEEKLLTQTPSISASGLYPIPKSETALQ